MNNRPIRNGVVLLILAALASCASQPTDQRQAAARPCDRGETVTCEEFAGEYVNCFCADRAELRQIFRWHTKNRLD